MCYILAYDLVWNKQFEICHDVTSLTTIVFKDGLSFNGAYLQLIQNIPNLVFKGNDGLYFGFQI